MAKRKSTGKALRFDVFNRDLFTCQYCGAQPPAVVLVVDHIEPAGHGGVTEIHNLITACEPCNQGKRDKVLGDRVVRPDADLLYLQTQQEIAELRRYQALIVQREAEAGRLVATIQDAWSSASDVDWVPGETVIRSLLVRHGEEVTYSAVIDVATKIGTGYLHSYGNKWLRYLNVVARNLAAEDD